MQHKQIGSRTALPVLAWLLSAAPVPSQASVLTFEPPPPQIAPGVFSGRFIQEGLTLYSADFTGDFQIVTLHPGIAIGASTLPYGSLPNAAVATSDAQDRVRALVGILSLPNTDLPGATDSMSITVVGTRPGQPNPYTIRYYLDDPNGDVFHPPLSGGSSSTLNGISGSTTVGRRIYAFALFPSDSQEGVDNITFNTPGTLEPFRPVPEAASLRLATYGLLTSAVLAFRRLRAKSD